MKKNIIVVGGGIAGMLSSLILAKNTNYSIHLIERTNKLGGLLKSFDYKEFGKFDYGAHNILETGIDELDQLLVDLLAQDDWQVSSAINGQKRALTGLYVDGKLQTNSPFIDLRNKKNIKQLQLDFLENFEKNQTSKKTTAYEYAKSIFGKIVTEAAIVPAFKSLYGIHPKKMDYMAMFLTPFSRIGLFDETIMKEFLHTKQLSRILAYPKQENLNSDVLGSRRAYYPKKYGIDRVINALEKELRKHNVNIHLENEVSHIAIKDNSIVKVQLKDKVFSDVKGFIWSGNMFKLTELLNLKIPNFPFTKPPKTVITNILISKKLKVGNLSYFYNYDKNFKTFRVDNYINYCVGAKRNGLYPVSIEMLLGEKDLKDIHKISDVAISELKSFGVLRKDCKIVFAKTEVLDYGFPLLSKQNIKTIDLMRQNIVNQSINNLTLVGILAEKDLFFESDIKKDLFLKMKELSNDN